MEVGKIKQVPLREIWKREDSDFTVWLEKNIDYLNDVLDFEVTIEEREKRVGSFSLDLYGDDGMGGKVIIENQLEKTDHDHLGKVLTYLTNLDAHRAIWITPQPRDEHGRAIDWLNEYTPDDIAFYLVKLDAIRIGDHPVAAPQFTVVKGPSEQIKQIGQEKKDSAARDSIRREFWTQFLERMSDVGGAFGSGEPSRHDYLSRGLGMTGLHQTVYCTGSYVRTEIYMSKNTAEDNKRMFDFFHSRREEIEQAFGEPLGWERLDHRVNCRIKHQLDGVDWRNDKDWPRILDFLVDSTTRMEQTFPQHCARLKSEW